MLDAIIISAPSLTKNEGKVRDPEMHQTRKGNDRHFGMKVHMEVDAHRGAVPTLGQRPRTQLTSAKATVCCTVKKIWCLLMQATRASKNIQGRSQTRMRPGKRKALGKTGGDQITRVLERLKSSVIAYMEHPFHYIKNVFSLKKVRN